MAQENEKRKGKKGVGRKDTRQSTLGGQKFCRTLNCFPFRALTDYHDHYSNRGNFVASHFADHLVARLAADLILSTFLNFSTTVG